MELKEVKEAYDAVYDAEIVFKQKAAKYINQIKDSDLTTPFEFVYEKYKHNITSIHDGVVSGITEHVYFMTPSKVVYNMRVVDLISILSVEEINELLNKLK